MSVNIFQIFLFAFYIFVIVDASIYAIKNRRECTDELCELTGGLHDARFVSSLFSIMVAVLFLGLNTWTFVYFLDKKPTDLELFWYFFDFLVGIYIWSNHHRFSITEKRIRRNS